MVLDDLDRALLRSLQEDARSSFRTLAARVGSTVPTVASRIRRMEDLGIIQGYTVRLDPVRFGGGPDRAADVDAPVTVACHECGMATDQPVVAILSGRRHPFCCTSCRRLFSDRHARIVKNP